MTRRDLPLDPELESLVRPPKIRRRAPEEVRGRALVRAGAIVRAGGAKPAAWPSDPPALASVSSASGAGRVRIAFAAAVAVVAVAVGAIASLRGRGPEQAVVAPESAAPRAVAMPSHSAFRIAPAEVAPLPAAALPAPRPPRVTRVRSSRSFRLAAGSGDPSSAELELLQGAQAAYTRREFSSALTLLGDHAQRFPRGHLAEEREALRVRCLLGAGRTGEAHRAAVAFGLRFPRSVLLPRVDSAESD